jgi:hypothetical protein
MAKKLLPYYNVEASVGKNGANHPEDVLLVEFMLAGIGGVPPHPFPPPTTPKCCKAENQHVIVDGRIDPSKTKDGSYYPPSAGHTLHLMNMTYRRRFRDSHDAMERDVTCPIALRVKFGFYDDIPL